MILCNVLKAKVLINEKTVIQVKDLLFVTSTIHSRKLSYCTQKNVNVSLNHNFAKPNIKKISFMNIPSICNYSNEKRETTDEKQDVTTAGKLKKAVKEYGSTVIVFHVGISLVSLGTSYLLVSNGVDVAAFMKWIVSEEGVTSSLVSNAGTFAVAYALHKVFAPVRIAITLTSVPFIVRILRKKGFLKKP